ncbi:MAG: Uma2 family endonuclease [Proteobacteria bacterium]|nr:Uma2 family endonuclease [Pseudomonadota bacterium]
MPVAARRIDPGAWTKEQFLAWCETRGNDGHFEFDGFRPVAMAPATLAHNDIGRNIREALRAKLPAHTGCRPYGPQQPIETVGGALREPDAFIALSVQRPAAVTISAPVTVFEVLSPGRQNRQRDEEEKLDEYESVPSILRYVIVESESRAVRVYWREPGERHWRPTALDRQGPVDLPEFGISLTLDEIYQGVSFN